MTHNSLFVGGDWCEGMIGRDKTLDSAQYQNEKKNKLRSYLS
jgi:hypothetical protein